MSVKLIFKEQNEELFWEYWGQICSQTKASPRYLKKNISYRLDISKANSLLSYDKSFIYCVNNKPEAGVFLPIEKTEKYFLASSNLDYIDAPLFVNSSIQKDVFLEIDAIASGLDLACVKFSIDPLDQDNDKRAYNFLQKFGYLDTSLLTYVIDLRSSLTVGDLLSNCRRGHRREIKKILDNKDFTTFVVDKNNYDYDIHEEYRLLHHKCAGRITRPKSSFDIQFEKLKEGHSILMGLKYKGKNIAFYYFDYCEKKALGFSSADDPEYDFLSLYHILFLRIMEYLKNQGVEYIDVGQPSSPSDQLDYFLDKKQKGIVLFKQGFPGEFRQTLRGEKYYDAEYFLKVYQKRCQEYANIISHLSLTSEV